jgi:abhydrolase domain-containing protein 17
MLIPCHEIKTGTPSEDNCYADIEAVFDYLVKDKKLSPHQIVLYGRSVGSGPSCWLARKSARDGASVGGLMLHSPFTSVYRVVLNFGFTMVGDKFPNIDNIKNVACPVIVCHGRDDEIVPFCHGVMLHNAVPVEFQAKPLWMERVGHNDHGPEAEAELMASLNRYLDYHILARRLYLKAQPSASSASSRLKSPRRVKRRQVVMVPRREV